MNKAYLLLGSNEGNRVLWLQRAIAQLAERCGNIREASSLYETAAWGITAQPDFLNGVVLIETSKSPAEFLTTILDIETHLGRHRTEKWGPRTIDIDILLYNHETVNTPELTIPHPYMQERRFTLVPLNEIAPDYIHPVFQKTIAELLIECPDKLEVRNYTGNV